MVYLCTLSFRQNHLNVLNELCLHDGKAVALFHAADVFSLQSSFSSAELLEVFSSSLLIVTPAL